MRDKGIVGSNFESINIRKRSLQRLKVARKRGGGPFCSVRGLNPPSTIAANIAPREVRASHYPRSGRTSCHKRDF